MNTSVDDEQKQHVNQKDREEQSRIRNTLMAFAGNTSAHGIGKLISPLWYVQALWLVLIIGAVSGLAYHMSTMVSKYMEEPVSTSVTLRGVDFVYPGVTVCNKKFLSVSAMAEKVNSNSSSGPPFSVANQVWQWKDSAAKFFMNLERLSSLTENFGLSYLNNISGGISLTSSTYLMQYEDNKDNLGPLLFRDSEGIGSFAQYSLHPEKLLIRCRFGPYACDISDFSVVQMHDNPYCITLNLTSIQKKNNILKNEINSYQLQLYYYTDSSHFFENNLIPQMKTASDFLFRMDSNGGADLYIHQPGAYPGTGKKIEIPNGNQAAVSVNYQEFEFVNIAKRECLSSYPADFINYWQRTASGSDQSVAYSYTNTDCFFNELQNLIYKQCGCLSDDYPVPNSLKAGGVPLCLNITQAYITLNENSTQTLNVSSGVSFLYQMVTAAASGSISMDIQRTLYYIISQFTCLRVAVTAYQVKAAALCTERCHTSQYSTQTSLYTWPSMNPSLLAEDLQKWLESNVYYRNNEIVLNQTFIREVNRGIYDILTQIINRGASIGTKNFLSIKLGAADQSGKSTVTEESLSYGAFDLLSDIGGILGLYLGVSVLTLCEVLELALGLIFFFVASIVRGRRRVQQQQQRQQQQPGIIVVKPASQQ